MITSTATSVSYSGDGVQATAWAVPFYFFSFTDLVVMVTASGVTSTYAFGSKWTGSGTPDAFGAYPNGGSITFIAGNVAPAGSTIVIMRVTARTQTNTFVDNAPFPATVLEHALDKLTLIAQENAAGLGGFLGMAAGPPTAGNYLAGQWFLNSSPSAGAPFGWICIAAGAPGTWNVITNISL